jgi:hypothetical protein
MPCSFVQVDQRFRMIGVVHTSETMVIFYKSARYNIPRGCYFQEDRIFCLDQSWKTITQMTVISCETLSPGFYLGNRQILDSFLTNLQRLDFTNSTLNFFLF